MTLIDDQHELRNKMSFSQKRKKKLFSGYMRMVRLAARKRVPVIVKIAAINAAEAFQHAIIESLTAETTMAMMLDRLNIEIHKEALEYQKAVCAGLGVPEQYLSEQGGA